MSRRKPSQSGGQGPRPKDHSAISRPADEGGPKSASVSPYTAALVMLGRRELSEQQVRERLVRKGYEADAIEDAVTRLKDERAVDDSRVAQAIARRQISIRRRGKMRVRREIEQAGIRGDTAKQALDAVFEDVDQDALLDEALLRRLRSDRDIADDRERRRLYRYLVMQGFESDKVLKALRARGSKRSRD